MKCGGSFKIYFSSVGGEIFHMLILFLHFLNALYFHALSSSVLLFFHLLICRNSFYEIGFS